MGAFASANSRVNKPNTAKRRVDQNLPPVVGLEDDYYQNGVRTALRRVRDLRMAFAKLKQNSPKTDDDSSYGKQTYRIGHPYQALWLHGEASPLYVDAQGRVVGKYTTRMTYNTPQARAFAAGFKSVSKRVNALLDVLDPVVPGTTTEFVGPPDMVRESNQTRFQQPYAELRD